MANSAAERRSPDMVRPNMDSFDYDPNILERQSIPFRIQNTPVSSLSSRDSPSIRIVLLGKSGAGKSAAGNTILGQREFRSNMCMDTVTHEFSVKHATVSGGSVSVVDTPGFFHSQMNPGELEKEIVRSVYLSSPGPHAFLIVLRVNDRHTEQEQQIPQMIEMMFGKGVLKYSIILFTHGDLLNGKPMETLIKDTSTLRRLVGQCGGRFHVLNNKDQNNREQVNDLLQKIDTMIEQNGGGHYSNQMFQDAQRFRREEEEMRKQQKKIARMRKKIGAEFVAQRRLETERCKAKIQSEEEGAIVNFTHFCSGIRSSLYGSHCSRFCVLWSYN